MSTERRSLKSIRTRFPRTQYVGGAYYRRRRRPLGGMFWARRRPTASAKATRALMLIRKFKKEEERKYLDTTVSLTRTNAQATGTFSCCNIMAQGNTAITRIGNKITMESLAFNGFVDYDTATPETAPVQLRVMIVMDRKPDNAVPGTGALPNGADLLTDDIVMGLYNILPKNKGRFQVLYDKRFAFSPAGNQAKVFKVFVDLNGKKAEYGASAGTVADLRKNAISIGLWYGSAAAASTVGLGGRARLRFTDA